MIQLEVFGNPEVWTAPRIFNKRHFDPKGKQKEATRWQIRAQYREELIHGPVMLDFIFFMPIPKATSKIKRKQMINGIILPDIRPDTTNMQKFYEDCLMGIVIDDDKFATDIHSRKRYSENPRVLIRVLSLGMEALQNIERCSDICPARKKGEICQIKYQ
jgi:Holliday junction resolvase RusA-like endonuclease